MTIAVIVLAVVAWIDQLVIGLQAIQLHRLERPNPELMFHGYGCPGHTTGLPAESCMAKEG